MTPTRFLAILVPGLLAMNAACAQWTISASTGLQHTELKEYDPSGRELVREHGWMPGASLRAEYAWQTWRFGIDGSTYRKSVTYDGRLQNGTPFASDTDATQDRLGFDATWHANHVATLIGGIEWEHRNRGIQGQAAVGGLDERTTSWRLLAGGQFRLAQLAAAKIDAKALLVFAQAERLRVRFDQQIFDDVSLSTKPAIGLRTALSITPTAMPRWSATLEFDWMKVRRSDSATLLKNGVQEGAVTQPEHRRRTLTAYVTYRFE